MPAALPVALQPWLAWAGALALTLVVAAWCTPRAWWRRPNLRALAERYCALLRLPHPLAQPVAGGARFTFGRGAPMLAALRVLDSPRFLRNAAGAPPTSADRLGLSRDAFSFEVGPEGWLIARLSASQDLYHLDEQLGFVAAIDTATPEQPYRLPPGHHLVAGHYVLRFDA